MVKSHIIALLYFFILFQNSFCKKVPIKNATFSDKSFLVKGAGKQWKLSDGNDGVETCSNGKEAEMWLLTKMMNARKILYNVQIHVEIEAQFTKCDGTSDCFKDGFELYRYIGNGEPDVPFDASNHENTEQEKRKTSEYFKANFTYLGYINGNTTIKERVNKTFFLTLKKFREITFGIKSSGACGKVFRMNVYYYVCEEKFINSVMFKETLSPSNGTKVVSGNCSLNSRPELSIVSLKAYCYSNGTWSEETDIKCSCDKGYEPTTKLGCTPCQNLWYKQLVANEKCIRCPDNTESAKNFTTCTCKDGYYKRSEDSGKLSRCYAPIQLEKPMVEKVEGSTDSVNITWLPPTNNSKINDIIRYDIHCYICVNKTFCNMSCTNLIYTPGQFNITETYVLVSRLVVGERYQFRVFPKTRLNKVIPREKWEFAASKPYIFTLKENGNSVTKEDNLTYLVVIVCVGTLTLLLVVFLITFCLRRRKEKNGLFQGLLANGVELPKTGKKTYVDPSNYDRPEDAICEFATEIDASLLYLEMLIGGGEFGDVYKGSMTGEDGKKFPIAVKTLKKDATPKSEKDFLLEASVMGQFDCPNVIKLIGVVTKYRPWMIVIEFMSNGSLDNFLKANDGRLSHLELINMAKGVAVGMEYLSGMNFVHRDLAARNVLVDGNLVCKVSDFGLSRELEATDSSSGEYATTGGKIPIRWTAPEATKYRKFSSASDVWSFGILLWEIISFAERPYWEWDNFRVMEEVDNGFRLPAPLSCPKGIHDLMMQCWTKERIERPNFNEINSVIDGWIQSPKTMEGDVDLSAALREWLDSIKMSDYVTNFTTAGYQRPCELYGIKEDDLKQMGISLVGHRNKILKGIRNLPGNKKGKRAVEREVSLEV